MKFKGGFNLNLAGRPSSKVEVLPEPDALFLPLRSSRFDFSEVTVPDGEKVQAGQVVAKDPANFAIPLLAPRSGTARVGSKENHIVIENLTHPAEEGKEPEVNLQHIPKDADPLGTKRHKLLMLGAWQFMSDANTGALPDPFGTPDAVIVSTMNPEPFVSRGDVQMSKRLSAFTRGIEQLQSLLEYQTIYMILPSIRSDFATKVRETLRGYARVKMVEVPRKYGISDFSLMARKLVKKPEDGKKPLIWAMGTEGVLAFDRALTASRSCNVRVISVGGPAASNPVHVKAMPGYPVAALLEKFGQGDFRVVNGGVFAGNTLNPAEQLGLDVECKGLTLVPEHQTREFLSFLRPGFDRKSYSAAFLSSLRPSFKENLTTALRGEARPCVSCNFCEEICPAGITPHQIHKYLYQDALEEAEKMGIHRCTGCGICAFVCPSKIEMRDEFIKAQDLIMKELHGEVEEE